MTDPNISMSDKMKFTEVMGSIKRVMILRRH